MSHLKDCIFILLHLPFHMLIPYVHWVAHYEMYFLMR